MTFFPDDHIPWDFWFAPRRSPDEPYHVFYLRAPRGLPHEYLRHSRAQVGHAISHDLVHWEAQPIALGPGQPRRWDDRATWTGSIVERDGLYYLFYTGTNLHQGSLIQRVGLATSDDLYHWERQSEEAPLLATDPRWYETLDLECWYEEACRDPFVVHAPDEDAYYMFLTVRANEGPCDARGVIGLARSEDLLHWAWRPPVSEPGEFGHLEAPQIIQLNGRYYAIFCTESDKHSAARLARTGPAGQWWGIHYLVADDLLGPYRLLEDEGLVADEIGSYYSGKIVIDPQGEPKFMAWRQWDDEGEFLAALSNPATLHVLDDGRLRVAEEELWPG